MILYVIVLFIKPTKTDSQLLVIFFIPSVSSLAWHGSVCQNVSNNVYLLHNNNIQYHPYIL